MYAHIFCPAGLHHSLWEHVAFCSMCTYRMRGKAFDRSLCCGRLLESDLVSRRHRQKTKICTRRWEGSLPSLLFVRLIPAQAYKPISSATSEPQGVPGSWESPRPRSQRGHTARWKGRWGNNMETVNDGEANASGKGAQGGRKWNPSHETEVMDSVLGKLIRHERESSSLKLFFFFFFKIRNVVDTMRRTDNSC